MQNQIHPTNPALWQGRKDTLPGERFFQHVDCGTKIADKYRAIILGFASDAGVLRNEGRPGARLGPDAIRMQLAKLPCSTNHRYLDRGTIICQGDNLEDAQSQLAAAVSFCHQQGKKTVLFGGGHEIAWGHFQGLAPHYPQLGIINFDAHFDLRPLPVNQKGNSGTPFNQIAEYCQANHRDFNYCCVGIQPLGNTQSLFNRASELNVQVLSAEEMVASTLDRQLEFLERFIQNQDHIYLSICMDVFAESYAPGVSAPQPLGIIPMQTLPLLKYIVQSGKVVSIDVAELSPPLDENGKTTRLAAVIIAELLEKI